MPSEFFSEQSVQHLCNEVLLCCVVQFRQAVGMLERNGVTHQNIYLQEMREGLRNMESEMVRRHLALDPFLDDGPVPAHPVLHFSCESSEAHQPA